MRAQALVDIDGITAGRDIVFKDNRIYLPPAPPPPHDQRWLDELARFVGREVEQWLESELRGGPLFRLDKKELSEVVNRRRPVLLGVSEDRLLDPTEPLGDVFAEEAGRSLLILGEPGAGKSVLLRHLARDLLRRAADGEPVPVLLDLAGWKPDGRSFIRWLASADGLRRHYRSFGNDQLLAWLREGRLTVLLDGLDEVPAQHRAACITSINKFVGGEGGGAPGGLAVSCQHDEYLALVEQDNMLKLGAALYLQPLNDAQVEAYFDAAGALAAPLRTAWQTDPAVRALARNPLMLTTMRIAYEQGRPTPHAPPRARILDAYVDRVFERAEERVARQSGEADLSGISVERVFEHENPEWATRDTRTLPYGRGDVMARLSWLAARMREHAKTTFYVEEMQPSWLDARQRWRYVLLSRLAGGLLMGLATGVLLLVGLGVSGTLYGLGEAVATGGLILVLSLGGALAVSGLDARRFRRGATGSGLSIVGTAVLIAAMGGVGAGLFALWGLRAAYGVLFGVLWGAVVTVVFEPGAPWRSARHDIRLVEPLRWSWRQAARASLRSLGAGGLAGGVLGGLVAQVGTGSASWQAVIVVSAVGLAALAAVVGGALGGLEHGNVRAMPRHNLGFRLSVRNAAFAGAVMALAASLALFPLVLASGAFAFGTALRWSLAGGLFCGTLAALRYGGLNAVYHAILRVQLDRAGRLPLWAAPFFRFAADLTLLRSAGGGYAFAHRYFAEYFADRADRATSRSPETVASPA